MTHPTRLNLIDPLYTWFKSRAHSQNDILLTERKSTQRPNVKASPTVHVPREISGCKSVQRNYRLNLSEAYASEIYTFSEYCAPISLSLTD
jgi:hypothetical protein